MSQIDLLLKILTEANAATPALVALIASIKAGRELGKTDDEIQAESMQLALDTRAVTEKDMGPQA